MYDTVPGDAILAFVIGSVEFGANDILFGIGFITLGRAIRDVNNKLEPAILLNIISFGALIIGIVFVTSHYMAINYVDDEGSAGFYPPYIEKRVVYPELYKDKKQ